MASPEWIGNAVNVADVCTITVANTWAAGDTGTLTINGKDLVVTAGTAVTTTDIASLLAAAVNSSTALSNATTGYSNVGGATIPEFAELIASSSGAVLTLTTRNDRDRGKRFQGFLTRSEVTAGSGTLGAVTSVQAGTRRNAWDNADNWSTGSVPANNDTVIFRDSDVDCTDGLPNASLEVTIKIYNSFTGRIGLPKVNRDNQQLPYYEYRQRYVRLDDSGAGSTMTHVIGIGEGSGPQLVNIRQATLTTTFEVEVNSTPNTGRNGEGTKVVNVVCAAGTTLNVRKGSVDASDQDGVSAAITAINISGREGNTSEIDVVSNGNSSTACTVIQTGGRLAIDWATWSTNGLTNRGGLTIVDTCGIPSAQVSNGTLVNMGNGTITALTLNRGGCLDVSPGAGTITVTNANYYAGCKVINPGKRITHTNAIATFGLLSEIAPQLDYGYNRTVQIAG